MNQKSLILALMICAFLPAFAQRSVSEHSQPVIFFEEADSIYSETEPFLCRKAGKSIIRKRRKLWASDWEVQDHESIIFLNPSMTSKVFELSFSDPESLPKLVMEEKEEEMLEIAVCEKGFYWIGAEREDLRFDRSNVYFYDFKKKRSKMLPLSDTINYVGLHCSRDGKILSFAHMENSNDPLTERHLLYVYDVRKKNLQLIDSIYGDVLSYFTRPDEGSLMHWVGSDMLVYHRMESEYPNGRLFSYDLTTREPSLLVELPEAIRGFSMVGDEVFYSNSTTQIRSLNVTNQHRGVIHTGPTEESHIRNQIGVFVE